MDCEIVGYGRLPLMITENCIIHNRYGQCGCQSINHLIDRKGARFPVTRAFGCGTRSTTRKNSSWPTSPTTTSTPVSGVSGSSLPPRTPRSASQVLRRYRQEGNYTPSEYTRGLYYRDVE